MPYLKVQTNVSIDDAARARLLERASAAVCSGLGKAQQYVMVAVEDARPMAFAGSAAPCAYLELKSIGLAQERTAELSRALCELIEDELSVPPQRTYIEFSDAPRAMWGWNRGTF